MKKIFFVLLITLAILERTVFDLGPNFELITSLMILSSFYLGKRESFWGTFLVLALTDLIIGNTKIFIFTWSGFLIPALFSKNIISYLKKFLRLRLITLTSAGLASNLFFYFWTNFGVWLLDSWRMYPKTLTGLVNCYLNGIPFLKYQFTSTLIFIPLGILVIKVSQILALKVIKRTNFLQNLSL